MGDTGISGNNSPIISSSVPTGAPEMSNNPSKTLTSPAAMPLPFPAPESIGTFQSSDYTYATAINNTKATDSPVIAEHASSSESTFPISTPSHWNSNSASPTYESEYK